jgi:hypothetical protein
MHLHTLPNCPPPWPLKPNDIAQLATCIQSALLHFNAGYSSCEDMYLTQLRIISNCYYLVRMEIDEHRPIPPLGYTNFKQHPEAIQSFALSMAEMINIIAEKVRLIDYPWFYPHFINALKHILSDKFCYLKNDLTIVHRLLGKILPPHRRAAA